MSDRPTLHCLALPHTQTTRAYDHCAYTAKVRKLSTMMTAQGYRVVLYAGDENEADCTELVTILSARKQRELLKRESWWRDGEIYALPYDETSPIWCAYNERAIKQIRKRIEPHDIICLASGTHAPVMRAFPGHMSVETGVGYEGVVSDYRVFESYAWMHTVYGWQQGAANADGRFYDTVIPNSFEVDEFPAGQGNGDYFLFMSRMTPRKGYEIAFEAVERAGAELIVAGVGGDWPETSARASHAGLVHGIERAVLLGAAKAIFVPTLYVEPFGGVAVEAQLCGTPVISTDFGAFTETVDHGLSGFRCHTLAEFAQACSDVGDLDRGAIREAAIARWSTENVGPLYTAYFERLQGLWGDGWYAE